MRFIEKYKPWLLIVCLFIGAGLARVMDIQSVLNMKSSPLGNMVLGGVAITSMAALIFLGYFMAKRLDR